MDKHWALLFEDQKLNAEVVIDVLDEFQVDWVSTTEKLEEKIKDGKYRVIVTDVNIATSPKPGYEVVDELRRRHRKTRVPVVVYSTVVNMDETRSAKGKLFYDYVDRNDKDQRKNLQDACRRAVKENTHTVSWNALEASFQQLGLLNKKIPKSDIPNRFIMGIYFDKDPSVDILLKHIKDKDNDDETWSIFEEFLLDLHDKYSNNA